MDHPETKMEYYIRMLTTNIMMDMIQSPKMSQRKTTPPPRGLGY
eukprot:CAMPEP_0178772976 /NCGR_PEP_ID=MMETSP0744-20121128/22847_1 /TAXON_ID=913974 /ORGANISM="Nitzschia punctata, Strain CCMP561" /LENGTH=43 /DNA_ID= /DNA_START= /DNA_END= /DNA_ORIENTATION=